MYESQDPADTTKGRAMADPLTDTPEGATGALHEKHFVMLRIAKLRGLKVRHIGGEVYAVTSYSRPGLEWVISDGVCTCPSKSFCTHIAAAVDSHFINEADPARYTEYTKALIGDRTQLRLRIRAGEETRSDKTYLRFCVRFYESKRAAAKAAGIRKVRVGGREVEYAGHFRV